MGWSIGGEAFFWGFISAVSLPIGAIIGIVFLPKQKLNSAFMAFGAGALLFALTIELFGGTLEHAEHHGNAVVFATIVGAFLGGILFDVLNQMLNSKGAFARSLSTAKRYLSQVKLNRTQKMVQSLGEMPLLRMLPVEKMGEFISHLKLQKFKAGRVIFKEGEKGDTLYFIKDGIVDIHSETKGGEKTVVATLHRNEIFGEIALVTDLPRTATAQAQTNVTVYKMLRSDFEHLLSGSPEIQEKISQIVSERIDKLVEKVPEKDGEKWHQACENYIAEMSLPVTGQEVIEETQKTISGGSGAALAIWLGIFIDGIPESLIIGMLATSSSGMSFAFIAGVFLANLPEAMSSAVSMLRGGMKVKKIMFMWGSLALLMGIGAFIGASIFPPDPQGAMVYWIAGIEGLAAGAMLTMIAETMLPEAFEQGGSIVGLSTLSGFVAALMVKLI